MTVRSNLPAFVAGVVVLAIDTVLRRPLPLHDQRRVRGWRRGRQGRRQGRRRGRRRLEARDLAAGTEEWGGGVLCERAVRSLALPARRL
eukprot:scaffold81749_cov51-Phaeocystis_antarctica.AAC.1